ncbi:hypothetical protein M0804_008480 [Polistes exclamans]|nr:hypothetical protein M0804_008480 [Polistes exclamans]
MIAASRVSLFNGHIAEINSSESAEIVFVLNDNLQKAYLCKQVYFYNARLIPDEDPLNKYVFTNMEVTFVCNNVRISELISRWVVVMCWPKEHSLGDKVDIKAGMIGISGYIFDLEDKQGTLHTVEYNQRLKIFFTLDKFFLHEKNLPSHPNLIHQLDSETRVHFDAMPCIPKENKYNCEWCATCVYIGQKPAMENIMLDSTNETATQVLQVIHNNFTNPLCVYIIGKGKFFRSIDDEFGLILAQFQDNLFKEILFHKKNAYVFNICMANEKLSDIFKKGDKMHFIAIAAEVDKFIDWIAVHVSVCDYGE